jgi:hypothetical protein
VAANRPWGLERVPAASPRRHPGGSLVGEVIENWAAWYGLFDCGGCACRIASANISDALVTVNGRKLIGPNVPRRLLSLLTAPAEREFELSE